MTVESSDIINNDEDNRGCNGNRAGEMHKLPFGDLEEDVVISGISGRFPECNNIEELKHNLYDGVDMVTETDRRWKPGLFSSPKRIGTIKELKYFDAFFFGVHGKQAEVMDFMQRFLLESVYECIFDAGYSPESFRGKKVGVFVGCSEKSITADFCPYELLTGYELLGGCRALLANRISFTYGFTGPSMTFDASCSSTMQALNQAIISIKSNRCDAAIVGGGNINFGINLDLSYQRLGLTSQEGMCKVFDAAANGYAKSEAVGTIFLQRASDARRCYATILQCRTNNEGTDHNGLIYPSSEHQKQLLKSVYCELGLHPSSIDYVEAHGSGVLHEDTEEANAIADVFLTSRKTLLLVGSVKSNLGHAGAASGICSVAKVILSMETGMLPPNLHYQVPNPNVPALLDGRVKVVAGKTSWKPGIVAINNFSLGGSNVHLVLQANQKDTQKANERRIPRLALASGRSESAVQLIFKKIEEDKFSDEALLLLEEACKAPNSGMKYRGFGLVREPGQEVKFTIEKSFSDTRPVWFLFSGMGSQWSQMAKHMMELDVFANSIKRSAQVLEPYGVDLLHLLTGATDQELNQIVAPFVTIAAIQIALVDMTKCLGIVPNGIVGHSVGELGCAYADGCFTSEQTMLAAYWRGQSCAQTELIYGAMAALGMSWEEAKERCPEGVFPVCNNADDSVTISGPAEKVHAFVQALKEDNMFARTVKTCDIAFHSKYVEPASVIMKKELAKVIPNPLPRSSRWVSSSVPEAEWSEPHAQMSSVEYHVNNLLSPVLFKEAMSKVHKDAIIIEFAPHSLLQAIAKRILGPESIYVGLMKRGHEDNLVHFLNAIGKLYISNLNPNVKDLYDKIKFPVSRGTPMLNSLIKWNHDAVFEAWTLSRFQTICDNVWLETFNGTTNEYLKGHKVDGRILFPLMGYVSLAWYKLSKIDHFDMEECPVIVEDFSVYRATLLGKSGTYTFAVKIIDSAGNFSIEDNGSLVASGRIRRTDKNVLQITDNRMKNCIPKEECFTMDAKDFYKELRLRGYEYGSSFQGVLSADSKGLSGRIKWDNRWVTFMDAMLQIPILYVPFRALLLPTRVACIRIDPRLKPKKSNEGVLFEFNPYINVCRAGPVEILGLHCGFAPKRKDHQNSPVLEKHAFVPLYDSCILSEDEKIHTEEYSHVCSTLALKILMDCKPELKDDAAALHGLKIAPDELVQQFIQMKRMDHVLLKVLKEVLDADPANGMKENLKSVFAAHEAETHEDLLGTVLLCETSLRGALDVVQDNNAFTKMKVLEVIGDTVCSKSVLKMLGMTTLGLVKFDYTIAHVNDKELPEGLIDGNVNVVQCDLGEAALPGDNDLVVSKDLFTCCCPHSTLDLLTAMSASVKENGFVLLMERTDFSPAEKIVSVLVENKRQTLNEDVLERYLTSVGLTMIAKKKDNLSSVLYLLRKLPENNDNDLLPDIINITADFQWVKELQGKMVENKGENGRPIWLICKEYSSGILGLMSCLRLEPEGRRLRCFIDASRSEERSLPDFEKNPAAFKEIFKQDLSFNVFKNGQWGMLRHRLLTTEPVGVPRMDVYANILKRGDLSSLRWVESNQHDLDPAAVKEKRARVQVYYSSLNFRDIMLASGKLPPEAIPREIATQDCIMGLECVGRDETGRRVICLLSCKGIATSISVSPEFLIPVPDQWTMEEASTVGLAYATAFYAMLCRGKMVRGESILIHSGTGGVGQAAIAVALSMACEVFVTVGSDEKRQILKEIFPEIEDSHVSSSRNCDFEFLVLNATNGKGVDLVLNSLAGDKLHASLRCLKKRGRFLEIGKYDMAMNSELEKATFENNVAFHAVFLDSVFMSKDFTFLEQLKDFLIKGVATGVVRPLRTNVFGIDQLEEAFRFMASGKHIGKVVIKVREEETDGKPIFGSLWIKCIARTYCHPRKSYLVTGALGGFGFELAGWLVERGARHLVLSCRSPIKNEYQRLWIERWNNLGVTTIIDQSDVASAEGAELLLSRANAMAPLGGIFHLAMVLHDGLFENLQTEFFEEVCIPKVKGAQQLDSLSRKMCPDLDHFVVFSSISCGRGNPGQSNYGYANSVMERIVEGRKDQGFPGLAIQWGGIGDVGVVYEKMGGNEVILKGTVPQRMNSCLDVMDRLMQEEHPVVSSFVPLEKAAFSSASDEDLLAMLCKILGISDPASVKPEMTLGELGMDSLMGVEIKQVLETEYDTVLSVPEVRQLSIQQLKEINEKKKKSDYSIVAEDIGEGLTLIGEQFIPTEVLVPLNELTSFQCVFYIHPVDGHVNMLKKLGINTKRRAYGLQFTDQVPCDTIQDIAKCYVQHIRDVQPQGPYNIVGYSFGAVVAFEIALQLQETDQVKTFISIDGSPASAVEVAQMYIKEDEKQQLSFTRAPIMLFLRHYFARVPRHVEQAMENLPLGDTISDARTLLRTFLGEELDGDVVISICQRLYKLTWAAKNYKPGGRFRGRATLIKSTKSEVLEGFKVPLLEDIGLIQHVDGTVEIFPIKCHHVNIVEDTSNEVSKIINDRI